MHWTVDQVKQFATALKQVGRNFFLIQKRYFSSTTAIDPFGGSISRIPRFPPRGRKRRRIAAEDPSTTTGSVANASNQQGGEEIEGNGGDSAGTPNNNEGTTYI